MMVAEARTWTVRLSQIAEADFQNIIAWTLDRFGEAQARVYADTLIAALTALAHGPLILGVKERADIGRGLFTLHVAREGRNGSHFVLFRVGPSPEQRVIDVLRVLHEAMDIARHIPAPAPRGQRLRGTRADCAYAGARSG